jgi:DNA-binding NarL/FixJ family response regulator
MMKFWQLLVRAHCTPRKVLIIDDDDALRESLKEQFTLHDEFEISDAATASAGLKQLRSEMVDLVVLDVRLPDMDGREACEQMRKSGYRGPIVVLTAQDTEADTILGSIRGPMTISPNRSASGCCLPASGRSCASSWSRTIRHRATMTTTYCLQTGLLTHDERFTAVR